MEIILQFLPSNKWFSLNKEEFLVTKEKYKMLDDAIKYADENWKQPQVNIFLGETLLATIDNPGKILSPDKLAEIVSKT